MTVGAGVMWAVQGLAALHATGVGLVFVFF